MSFASASSSSAGGAVRLALRPRSAACAGSASAVVAPRRSFAAAAPRPGPGTESLDIAPEDVGDVGPSSSHASSSRRSSPPLPAHATTELTPARAQTYLSDLLRLPTTHAFPPRIAQQLLTHKSYRYAHLVRHVTPGPGPGPSHRPSSRSNADFGSGSRSGSGFGIASTPDPAMQPSSVSHNARFAFLGRRALAAYLALFVHSHLHSSSGLAGVDFLRGKGLEAKLDGMRHAVNLGREVGERWGVADVMRWDRNETSTAGGAVRIQGQVVESIIGGVFATHGSPAAQRAFYLHVLPHLATQLRDPLLIERAEGARDGVMREAQGGIVLP